MRKARRSCVEQSPGASLAPCRRSGEGGSAGFARDATVSAPLGRLPRNLDFSPANDDIGAEPISSADFDLPRLVPAQLELSVALTDPSDDGAPRIELPPALIAALDDAA
jgi:hypothetical protein